MVAGVVATVEAQVGQVAVTARPAVIPEAALAAVTHRVSRSAVTLA